MQLSLFKIVLSLQGRSLLHGFAGIGISRYFDRVLFLVVS